MIIFPTPDLLVQMHDAILLRTGGSAGLRDRGALEGAIGAVVQRHAYEDADVPTTAAWMAGRIAKAHAFADGNKRASVGAFHLTLVLNGWRCVADPETVARVAVRAAASHDGISDFQSLLSACTPNPSYDRLMDYDRGTWS